MSSLYIHKNGTLEFIESSDGRLTLSVPIQFRRRAGRKQITLPTENWVSRGRGVSPPQRCNWLWLEGIADLPCLSQGR